MPDIISRADAKQKELNTYYSGIECKYGHLSERRVSNKRCIQCDKEYHDSDAMREKKREAYRNNPDPYLKRSENQRLEKPEQMRKYKRKWRKSEKGLQQGRDWTEANRDKHNETVKAYKKGNPGKVLAATRKRQCAKLQRTPPWVDLKAIEKIYEESARLTKETGIQHHVDHDIPLQGTNVSGLHIAENLVILEATDNLSKGNSFA